MCRKSIYFVSLIIVLSLAGYLSAAEVDAEIPQTGFPKPILDGVMDDVWLYSTEQFITNTNSGADPTSPADCSGSWWALWEPEYLYLLVEVNDEALVQDSDAAQGWLDDRIEVFLDGDNSKDAATDSVNDYQYCFRWNHGEVEIPVEWYLSPGSLQGVEYGVTTTDSGYMVEIKLPWSTMIGGPAQLDQLIGIDVAIDDDDDGGDVDTQASWYMDVDGGSPHVPNLWGTAMLVTGLGEPWPYAYGPKPEDGALNTVTWATLSWNPGALAASHDIYIGDNFDDVNEAARDSNLFRGNQGVGPLFYVAGITGYAYPDGLVPGTTYYWRIDEVNDAEPNSPWKGEIWSFLIPPNTAYFPDPVEGAEFVDLNIVLSWTAGNGAKLHYIIFGEDFDEVSSAEAGVQSGPANYTPGPLELAKTYYWRVDEYDGDVTHKGDVWSFTTEGAVSGPDPANGAVDVKPSVVLGWDAGAVAASHEMYFGTDANAVRNATTASPEYKGPKALGEESFNPGMLTLNTAYFWRIDEVNGASADSPWAGNVWSFTTGDFFVIDDFEDYNTEENQIWFAWHDGLGAGLPGTPGYIPGNGTGSAVGDETTLSYTEETIVQGGLQSMPLVFDNNKQGYSKYSEVEHKLTVKRNWTEEGVVELSLWFHGDPNNSNEPLYVAVSNTAGQPAVVVHEDPAVANIVIWTEWVIPLQAFTDQGINLANVDRIVIGLGTKGNLTIPGGSGKMYFDDIRLYQPREAAEE